MRTQSAPVASELTEKRTDPRTGEQTYSQQVSKDWIQWFFALTQRIDRSPQTIATVPITKQTGSLPMTPLPLASHAAGMFRVNYYARLTRAAGTSSSLTVVLQWYDNGTLRTYQGPALTANTLAAGQSQSVLIQSDAASPISYGTIYASAGAPSMEYALNLTIEEVP